MDYGIHGCYKQNVATNVNTKSQITYDYTKEKYINYPNLFSGSKNP